MFHDFLSSDFFSKLTLSGTLSGCQMVCILVCPALVWVQTVCKGYQQTTKIVASKEGVMLIVLVINGFITLTQGSMAILHYI